MQPSPRPLVLIASVFLLALATSCNDDAGPGAAPEPAPSSSPTTAAGVAADTDAGDPRLLFQRAGTKRPHIAWVALDGSGESAPLTDFGDGAQTNPDWSPDGDRLVFVMTDGATDDLFVADAGATQATKLLDCVSPCVYLDDPSWSPDGEQVVYSRTVDQEGVASSTLESVEVATGEVHVLLGPLTEQFTAGARWSPDGNRLVFELVSKVGPGLDADVSGVTLCVVRLDLTHENIQSTTDPAQLVEQGLTDPRLFAATADWSPDGRSIVYSALPAPSSEAPDLFLIDARGGETTRLTRVVDDGGYASEPTFTPDGGGVVFSGGRSADEGEVLLVVSTDGTRLALATGDVEVHGRHPRVR